MKIRATIQMLALFLAGCASGNGNYPSLAKRPIETVRSGAVAVPVAPVVAEDPALAREISGLLDKARAGAAAFDAHVVSAQARVRAAAGSRISSEAWVDAQQAISLLESDRYDSIFALASLDTLYMKRSNAIASGEAQGGAEAIDAARSDVLAIVDRQNDLLDEMKGRLATP
jgi:hypothetical protein